MRDARGCICTKMERPPIDIHDTPVVCGRNNLGPEEAVWRKPFALWWLSLLFIRFMKTHNSFLLES